MGNEVCCEISIEESKPIEKTESEKRCLERSEVKQRQNGRIDCSAVLTQERQPDKVSIPKLLPRVKRALDKYQFFKQEFTGVKQVVNIFGKDIYSGEIGKQNQKPHGLGKLFKKDGSLFIGYFINGRAEVRGAYIFPDGSYYIGGFENNQASSPDGYYESESVQYSGGFRANMFDGKGKEQGKFYSFEGEYVRGKKKEGIMSWKGSNGFNYQYRGCFNDLEQFNGKGILVDELGTYEGAFTNGFKEGQGEYRGLNQMTYRGEYRNDQKEGFGTIYNNDNSITFQGQFKKGLPHGKGSSFTGNCQLVSQWQAGINIRLLEDSPNK